MHIREHASNGCPIGSSSVVALSSAHAGTFHVEGLTLESTIKATELLQENHERYHIFFNELGFHNHTAHYILTAWTLAATPTQLDRAFREWLHVQRSRDLSGGKRNIVDVSTPDAFISCLNKDEFFEDYIRFFDSAVAQKGIAAVLEEYLFSATELSVGLFRRLFASMPH